MRRITLKKPDDWHLHLRDGSSLPRAVADSAARFARAIIMPNLVPPVTTVERALDYRRRILAAVPEGLEFEPLMTLYLTDRTEPAEVKKAAEHADIFAFKLYPAGATTHSDQGVTRMENTFAALEEMQAREMPLLVHGEVVDAEVDVFDREAVFIERSLAPVLARFAGLRVVLEHISTQEGVELVRAHGAHVGGTITAHHLLMNRNAIFNGGLRPHHFCLPVAKRETHRLALVEAATNSDGKFFLGTDSAPHPRHAKESACGCAGIYTSHAAIELYTEVFEQAAALDELEAFASLNGPAFYGLEPNSTCITLERRDWTVPDCLPFGEHELIPFRAGEPVRWQLVSADDG